MKKYPNLWFYYCASCNKRGFFDIGRLYFPINDNNLKKTKQKDQPLAAYCSYCSELDKRT